MLVFARVCNAADLAGWVRDRAVEQGCPRETIELEDWYTHAAEGNIWSGIVEIKRTA